MNSLTILIPTRNRELLLIETLTSVRLAFGSGQRVIIGDNGNPTITKRVLSSFQDLQVVHLENAKGSSYVQNLDILVRSCVTEWLSILHDDDIYLAEAGEILESIIHTRPEVDFIFSAHPIIDESGEVNEEKTAEYSKSYQRDDIPEGVTDQTTYYAARMSIALDGFFVKTALAQSVYFDTSLLVYDDNRWLLDVCQRSSIGYYTRRPLFAYRVCQTSLTTETSTSDTQLKFRIELYKALSRAKITCPKGKKILRKRKRRIMRSIIAAWVRKIFS